MNTAKEQSIHALVAAKQGVSDTVTPEIDPHGDPLFEVAFETAQGVKVFWVNSCDYYALHIGMQGKLVWKGDQFVSFQPWIKAEFPME